MLLTVRFAVSSGGIGTLADTLEVRSIYDFEGNTEEVAQTALPDRNTVSTVSRIFTYDAAHRKLKERFGTINAGPEWRYDPAGNVVFGGRTSGVTNTYDALNRLERRSGTDTSVFTHDALGNVKTANNEYAEVSRTYYRNGQLESETLRIATADSTALDFTKHQYQLFYTYDLAGRRESVRHPSQLRPGSTPNTGTLYTYDARTGQVETVTDVFGVVFRHSYDAMGRLDSLIRRSGLADSVIEARTYDLESRMKTRVQRTAAGADLRPVDGLDYDGRGKISVGSLSDEFTYDALGHLTHTCLYTAGGRCEDFELDALGNRKWTNRSGGHAFGRDDFIYQAGTGRLTKQLSSPNLAPDPDTTTYEYDVTLGNVTSTVTRRIL